MSVVDMLADLGYEDTICFKCPEYDRAIIGITTEGRLVYSYEKMVQQLVEDENMTEEEAHEFVDFNTLCSIPCSLDSSLYPIVMQNLILV